MITNNNQHVEATGGWRGHAPIEKGRRPPLNHRCGANEARRHQCQNLASMAINMSKPTVEGEDMAVDRDNEIMVPPMIFSWTV